MPKAKNIKLCALTVMLLGVVAHSSAQSVLDQVISQTKQDKLRQSQGSASIQDEAQPMQLWSISGINNNLVGEIWQGDVIHRLQLRAGNPLPNGWQIVSADSRSVTIRRGLERRKLYPAAPGSTGWEFAQTPRVMVAPAGQLAAANTSGGAGSTPGTARFSASNLPPMQGFVPSNTPLPSPQVLPQVSPQVSPPVPSQAPSAR
jgi:hypothetical protein